MTLPVYWSRRLIDSSHFDVGNPRNLHLQEPDGAIVDSRWALEAAAGFTQIEHPNWQVAYQSTTADAIGLSVAFAIFTSGATFHAQFLFYLQGCSESQSTACVDQLSCGSADRPRPLTAVLVRMAEEHPLVIRNRSGRNDGYPLESNTLNVNVLDDAKIPNDSRLDNDTGAAATIPHRWEARAFSNRHADSATRTERAPVL
jgi:hypothetical protein